MSMAKLSAADEQRAQRVEPSDRQIFISGLLGSQQISLSE
jgi:hypothetical protein